MDSSNIKTKKPHVLSDELLQQLKKYLGIQIIRKDIIGLFDGYFCSSCSLCAKKEVFSEFISEWHEELQQSVENTERMIKEGSP